MSDADKSKERPRKALVVGGGPVGALTALSLNRRGWDVELWESRDDPRGRTIAMTNLRSINLNISSRGLAALNSVDPSLAELLLSESIPMASRMIHHVDGRTEAQLYDPLRGQCSNSISRSVLNQRLVESLPDGVNIRFNTKLARVDFSNRIAYSVSTSRGTGLGEEGVSAKREEAQEPNEGSSFDLIIGCDGSWSKVRTEMMRVERVDFSQSFIPHAYIELHMPPDPTKPGGYAMPPNHLHIWPRHAFMLIALPNKDGSFTLTIFLPFSALEQVKSREDAVHFFDEHFPSAVKIVGDRLIDDFMNNPRGNLVTLSVSPSTWSSHGVLLGDACHSMVPFYGQGLNCGLEDVRVLNSYLENHSVPPTTTLAPGETDPILEAALTAYSRERAEDLKAICELALNNYTEMRSHVLSPLHHLRRGIDYVLTRVFPSLPAGPLSLTEPFPTRHVSGWTSLYEMVTFRPDIGYAEALRREQWQRSVVGSSAWAAGATIAAAAGVLGWRISQAWLRRR